MTEQVSFPLPDKKALANRRRRLHLTLWPAAIVLLGLVLWWTRSSLHLSSSAPSHEETISTEPRASVIPGSSWSTIATARTTAANDDLQASLRRVVATFLTTTPAFPQFAILAAEAFTQAILVSRSEEADEELQFASLDTPSIPSLTIRRFREPDRERFVFSMFPMVDFMPRELANTFEQIDAMMFWLEVPQIGTPRLTGRVHFVPTLSERNLGRTLLSGYIIDTSKPKQPRLAPYYTDTIRDSSGQLVHRIYVKTQSAPTYDPPDPGPFLEIARKYFTESETHGDR